MKCALNELAIDEPLDYARLALDSNLQDKVLPDLKQQLADATGIFKGKERPTPGTEEAAGSICSGCKTRAGNNSGRPLIGTADDESTTLAVWCFCYTF